MSTPVWSLVAVVAIGVSTSQGMLLEVGSRLDYRVWRGWQSDSTHTRLTVLGTSVTDSGERWRIGIHDSALTSGIVRRDTALLRNSSGRLVWDRPSCLIAWDPAPTLPVPFAGYYGTSPQTLLGGGVLAGACFAWDTASVRLQGWGVPQGLRWVGMNGVHRIFQWSGTDESHFDLPKGIHLRDTGWVRVRDTVSKEDWRLVALDGKVLPEAWQERFASKLRADLDVGSRWTWRVSDVEDSSFKWSRGFSRTDSFDLSWSIVGVLADSVGWIRRTLSVSSGRDSLDTDSMALRVNLQTGIARVSRPSWLLNQVAEAFVGFWYDGELPGEDHFRSRSAARISVSWARDSLVVVGRDGVGPLRVRSVRASGIQSQGLTTRTLEATLTSKDGVSVATGRRRASRRAGSDGWVSIADFLQELEKRPSSSVRLVRTDGRKWTLAASEIQPFLRSFRGMAVAEIRDGNEIVRSRILLP